jgi:hypothetical protein
MFLAIQNHTHRQPVSSLSKLKLKKGERKAGSWSNNNGKSAQQLPALHHTLLHLFV